MTEEEPLGMMLYGYETSESAFLQAYLSDILQRPVIALSASGKEDVPVQMILEDPGETFEKNETKILMFLGFDDLQIGLALDQFPKDGSISRPIFCGLTEENINWPLNQLLEHLREEEKYWKNKKAGDGPPPDEDHEQIEE